MNNTKISNYITNQSLAQWGTFEYKKKTKKEGFLCNLNNFLILSTFCK